MRLGRKPLHHCDTEIAGIQQGNYLSSAVACSDERFEQDGTELDDIARAECEDQVAGLGRARGRGRRVGEGSSVNGLSADSLGQQTAADSFDGRFAGGIDVEHRHGVGVAKGGGEIAQQQLRAGVAVRLEDDVNAAEAALPRRCQGGTNFRGMVPVVIDDGDTVDPALELEAAVHAAEIR